MKKRLLLPVKRLVCLVFSAFLLTGCTVSRADETKLSATGFYFDTVITLQIYGGSNEMLAGALEKCEYYENLLSKTVEGSDVWRINHAEGQPVTVSQDMITLLNDAGRYEQLSSGSFDITIAPVVALWDFTASMPSLPAQSDIDQALKLVDYSKISIDGDQVTLPVGMEIDLGAIAKGYICDKIREYLVAAGIDSGILNFGGNAYVFGSKPDGSPFRVGIRDPQGSAAQSLLVVELKDMSVVTSGTYERCFELDGVRYHHILDTATGWPVQNELASVSIITPSSMDGDALSTTLFTLGTEKGRALAESLGVDAIFIDKDNQITVTKDFPYTITTLSSSK